MKWYELEDEKARQAHARLSLELPVHFHSPLKISQPVEKDERQDEYIPAWKRRGVWDV
jgi:hypothetical protein